MQDPIVTKLRPIMVFHSWKSKAATLIFLMGLLSIVAVPLIDPTLMSPAFGLVVGFLFLCPFSFMVVRAEFEARRLHFRNNRISEEYFHHLRFRYRLGVFVIILLFLFFAIIFLFGLIGTKKNVLIRAVPTPELIAQVQDASHATISDISSFKYDGSIQNILFKIDTRDDNIGLNRYSISKNKIAIPKYFHNQMEIIVDYESKLAIDIHEHEGEHHCFYSRETKTELKTNGFVLLETNAPKPYFLPFYFKNKILIRADGDLIPNKSKTSCENNRSRTRSDKEKYKNFSSYQKYPHISLKTIAIEKKSRISLRSYAEMNEWFESAANSLF